MESPAPIQPTLFRLAPEIRIDIYRLVLSLPHTLRLIPLAISDKAKVFIPDRPPHWTALLYTNRQIHAEASQVLYQANHFSCVDNYVARFPDRQLQAFLDAIGPVNAGHLSHVSVTFPLVTGSRHDRDGMVTWVLGEPRVVEAVLTSLGQCARLTRLEMTVSSQRPNALRAPDFNFKRDSEYVREALERIKGVLRGISSLRDVRIGVEARDPLAPDVVGWMQGFGWVIEDVEGKMRLEDPLRGVFSLTESWKREWAKEL